MRHSDFYAEYLWCPSCAAYVHYLNGMSEAFCCRCGCRVRRSHSRRTRDEIESPLLPTMGCLDAWPTELRVARGPDPPRRPKSSRKSGSRLGSGAAADGAV